MLTPPLDHSKPIAYPRDYFGIKYDNFGSVLFDQRWNNGELETIMKVIGTTNGESFDVLRVIYGYMISDKALKEQNSINLRSKKLKNGPIFLKYRNENNKAIKANITNMMTNKGIFNYESVLELERLLDSNVQEVLCNGEVSPEYSAIRKKIDPKNIYYNFGRWGKQEQKELEKFAAKLMNEDLGRRNEL